MPSVLERCDIPQGTLNENKVDLLLILFIEQAIKETPELSKTKQHFPLHPSIVSSLTSRN